MKTYRLCFVTPEGRIDTAHEITCADDFDALAEAERAAGNHVVEVWDGGRLVVRVDAKRSEPGQGQQYFERR